MVASRKKVILRKFGPSSTAGALRSSREWMAGYASFGELEDEGQLRLLDLEGKLLRIPLDEVKWLCFVRDFNSGEPGNPERLIRKQFSARPRQEGVWIRLTLADGDELEGLAANDKSLFEGSGLLLTPPDVRSNTQRIYLPNAAILQLTVAGVILPPAAKPAKTVYPGLFTETEKKNEDEGS
jgi:hypothetical protein